MYVVLCTNSRKIRLRARRDFFGDRTTKKGTILSNSAGRGKNKLNLVRSHSLSTNCWVISHPSLSYQFIFPNNNTESDSSGYRGELLRKGGLTSFLKCHPPRLDCRQRQETLDLPYLTLLCDNLKNRMFLQNFFPNTILGICYVFPIIHIIPLFYS
jgi:hypothetical protein